MTDSRVGGGDSPGDITVQPAPSNTADELREALDDPKRGEWGGYPWEHLGDAERDVRVLLAELAAARAEAEQLREALEQIAEWTWSLGYERHALADLQGIAVVALAEAAPEETP